MNVFFHHRVYLFVLTMWTQRTLLFLLTTTFIFKELFTFLLWACFGALEGKGKFNTIYFLLL